MHRAAVFSLCSQQQTCSTGLVSSYLAGGDSGRNLGVSGDVQPKGIQAVFKGTLKFCPGSLAFVLMNIGRSSKAS